MLLYKVRLQLSANTHSSSFLFPICVVVTTTLNISPYFNTATLYTYKYTYRQTQYSCPFTFLKNQPLPKILSRILFLLLSTYLFPFIIYELFWTYVIYTFFPSLWLFSSVCSCSHHFKFLKAWTHFLSPLPQSMPFHFPST